MPFYFNLNNDKFKDVNAIGFALLQSYDTTLP